MRFSHLGSAMVFLLLLVRAFLSMRCLWLSMILFVFWLALTIRVCGSVRVSLVMTSASSRRASWEKKTTKRWLMVGISCSLKEKRWNHHPVAFKKRQQWNWEVRRFSHHQIWSSSQRGIVLTDSENCFPEKHNRYSIWCLLDLSVWFLKEIMRFYVRAS